MIAERNWSGTAVFRPRALHRPATLDELRRIVARARQVRVLGSRHSFTRIPDAEELVVLDRLDPDVVVDRVASTVSFSGALSYGELADVLRDHGLALHNLASLPHISVAGAVATGTHGSGDRAGNLATAVAALELVTSGGEVVRAARGDADFDGMVVGLGALGAVTRLTLDLEPAYDVRQRVFEDLAWEALEAHFDAIMGSGESVSVFTRWGETAGDVWVKARVGDVEEAVRTDLAGARPATVERHPVPGGDPRQCTPQLGVPGSWSERLPHSRSSFKPGFGEEIQSEYFVARSRAGEAVDALRRLTDVIRPVLLVAEIRTIAADGLWMSPQHERDTVALHFTWIRDPDAVARVVADVEDALLPLGARPHWGKLFLVRADAIGPCFRRLGDFARLAGDLDPRGAFRNAWLEDHVLGAADPAQRRPRRRRQADPPA